MAKILVGICGISYGHLNRQKVVIEHLQKDGHKIQIFTFGTGPDYCKNYFPQIPYHNVWVPWIVCNSTGVNFNETANKPFNTNQDSIRQNYACMEKLESLFDNKKADLVISDYEPISAQYAYARDIKLITLDQQSKFIYLPYEEIHGLSSFEEKYRLKLFFPSTYRRIACSFFDIPQLKDAPITIVPSFLKTSIERIKKERNKNTTVNTILIYQSSMLPFHQDPQNICKVLAGFPSFKFYIFSPKHEIFQALIERQSYTNIYSSELGSYAFEQILAQAKGVITTGGHNFLSELMYLEIPAYVTPLRVFEQQKSAKVIAEKDFGIFEETITYEYLKKFLENIDNFTHNIKNDTGFLFKRSGIAEVMKIINHSLNELI